MDVIECRGGETAPYIIKNIQMNIYSFEINEFKICLYLHLESTLC